MHRHTPEVGPMYSERNGVGVKRDLAELSRPPKHKLSPEDTDHVIEYSYQLFEGESDTAACEAGVNLETLKNMPAESSEQTFYLRYFFTTPQGRADLQSLGIHNVASFKDASAQLADIASVNAAATKKFRQEAAARSLDWYKAELAKRLLRRPETDQFYTDESEVTVNYDPEKLLTKLEGLQAYRRFYAHEARVVQQQPNSPLTQAKKSVLALHISRVNSLVAEQYSLAFNLARQLYASNTPADQDLKERLSTAMPLIDKLFGHLPEWERDELVDAFAQRLDLVRNGADWEDTTAGGKHVTPVSHELRALVRRLEHEHRQPLPEPLLPVDVIAQLEDITWNAEQMRDFAQAVLKKWNMLSQHATTWVEAKERTGPAPDGLFQVVITPEKDSFWVDSDRMIAYVPESFKRGLTDVSPSGVLPICAHELEHCVQALYDKTMGEKFPLARIKGRRYITMREAGGVYIEKQLFETYLGKQRGTNLHYLKALDAKLAGGNKAQVARAFYNSLQAHNKGEQSEAKDKKARALAVDRSLRLYRNSGYNSQPLDYIEQALIVEALQGMSQEQTVAFLTAAGSFNSKDLVTLHRLGLAEIPKKVDIHVVNDVMQVFLEQFAQKHLA